MVLAYAFAIIQLPFSLFLDLETASREAWIMASALMVTSQRKTFLLVGASISKGKIELFLISHPLFANPFDFAVAITQAPPVMPNWRRKRLPPLTLLTPMMKMTHGASVASGM